MAIFIICFSLAAILYILFLPFIGKRARKKKAPVKQWRSYEENMKVYNKFVGLPENSVFGER